MKILITGRNSYIGNHLSEWLRSSNNDDFEIEILDVRTPDWKLKSFAGYDAIVHVAGIVHRKDITDPAIYHKVNTELSFELAEKAKGEGVKQFVFLSTMAVYGVGKKLKPNYIDLKTPISPSNPYGDSKYNAELKLQQLEDGDFVISIIRPPNVYGKDCKGGYITGYANIVKRLPYIPDAYSEIKQSIIYIDNLCEFIRLVLINKKGGVYLPQDNVAVSAVELMVSISNSLNLNKKKSKILGLLPYFLSFLPLTVKGYGGIAYSHHASQYEDWDYIVTPFPESMRLSLNPSPESFDNN